LALSQCIKSFRSLAAFPLCIAEQFANRSAMARLSFQDFSALGKVALLHLHRQPGIS